MITHNMSPFGFILTFFGVILIFGAIFYTQKKISLFFRFYGSSTDFVHSISVDFTKIGTFIWVGTRRRFARICVGGDFALSGRISIAKKCNSFHENYARDSYNDASIGCRFSYYFNQNCSRDGVL